MLVSPVVADGGRAVYTVSLAAANPRLAQVEAQIPLAAGDLLMYPEGAEAWEHGWATFVDRLVALDEGGKRLDIVTTGRDAWKVVGAPPGTATIRLRYSVRIEHDQHPTKWDFGYKEVAYARPDFVFLTGKALFITQMGQTDIAVHFDLPRDWRVLSGWERVPASPATFRVKGPQQLTEVAIAVGTPVVHTRSAGTVTAHIASGRGSAASAAVIAETVGRLLESTRSYFGAAPVGDVLIVAEVDPAYVGGGAAFHRSVSLLLHEPATVTNRRRWGHILAHELFHLWNGQAIQAPIDGQEYWFTEGFTEYVSSGLEARLGLITSEELLGALAEHARLYLASAGEVSMRDAGQDKAAHYDLVYSGGAMVAFALDVELLSRGGDGLRTLMRGMFERFGDPNVRRFTVEDVRTMASEVGSWPEASGFLASFVTGTSTLPVDAYFRRLGLRLERAEHLVRLVPLEAATEEQRQIRERWLAGGW